VRRSETALRTWSELVVDPTDLGTLAALNAYGHDYLRGLAWQIYLESQSFRIQLMTNEQKDFEDNSELAGTARLSAIAVAALSLNLAQSAIGYLLPLFFPARQFSGQCWETWGLYSLIAWIVASPLAGMMGHRLGERATWGIGALLCALSGLLPIWSPASGPGAELILRAGCRPLRRGQRAGVDRRHFAGASGAAGAARACPISSS